MNATPTRITFRDLEARAAAIGHHLGIVQGSPQSSGPRCYALIDTRDHRERTAYLPARELAALLSGIAFALSPALPPAEPTPPPVELPDVLTDEQNALLDTYCTARAAWYDAYTRNRADLTEADIAHMNDLTIKRRDTRRACVDAGINKNVIQYAGSDDAYRDRFTNRDRRLWEKVARMYQAIDAAADDDPGEENEPR